MVTKQLSSDKIPTFEEFTFVDEGVAVTGMLSDDEFVKFLIKAEDSHSDEENQDEKPPDITPKEYKAAVHTLRMLLEKISDAPDSVFSSIVLNGNMVDKRVVNSLKLYTDCTVYCVCTPFLLCML